MYNRKILIFLLKGFETIEFSAFFDVFGWTNLRGYNLVVETVGFTKLVNSSFNINLMVNKTISEINVDNYDAIAIPGGFGEFGYYEEAYKNEFSNLIREFDAKEKIIATNCSGAFPLAKSGILKNREATTYHLNNGYWQNKLKNFDINVKNKPIIIDNNIITSSSPATAPNVALELLKMLTSEKIMKETKELMGYQDN